MYDFGIFWRIILKFLYRVHTDFCNSFLSSFLLLFVVGQWWNEKTDFSLFIEHWVFKQVKWLRMNVEWNLQFTPPHFCYFHSIRGGNWSKWKMESLCKWHRTDFLKFNNLCIHFHLICIQNKKSSNYNRIEKISIHWAMFAYYEDGCIKKSPEI